MALVCDIKSDNIPIEEKAINDDLEDGEIEDDDDDDVLQENVQPPIELASSSSNTTPVVLPLQQITPQKGDKHEKYGAHEKSRHERSERRKHEEKKKHLTEAEKSVMHLHKLERMEREKREKYKRDNNSDLVDDFASNIEKAIASVLKKDKNQSDQDIDEKRGKKRKKDKNRKRQSKKLKIESPKSDEFDESEMLNIRGGSPEPKLFKDSRVSSEKSEDYESYDSEYSSERSNEDRKERKRDFRKGARQRNRERARERKYRERSRDKKNEPVLRDGNICIYNLQGKCTKAEDCPYNHDVVLPMKLELCKFYLMDCCAKGDKCLYMHSEFPCKFYHTGIPCYSGDDCKFAHGKPLSDPLRHILFKHIETAPKEILGEFPRLSREGAQSRIIQAQKNLEIKYGMEKKDNNESVKSNIPSLFDINIPVPFELLQNEEKKEKTEKPQRNRPSRWQDPDPEDEKIKMALHMGFMQKDQDMRISSNGDIDMRTLPPQLATLQVTPPSLLLNQIQIQQTTAIPPQKIDLEQYQRDAGFITSTIQDFRKDVDIRNQPFEAMNLHQQNESSNRKEIDIHKDVDARSDLFLKDVDIRHYASSMSNETEDDNNADEPKLQIVVDEECEQKQEQKYLEQDTDIRSGGGLDIPANLPKTQRELFLRIQAQQKENTLEKQENDASDNDDNNVDWYSDDDDDDPKLTIKVDDEKELEKPLSPPQIQPQEIVQKLGDLSKVDISAEVTKLLTSISQKSAPKDPRQAAQDATRSAPIDPRMARRVSSEKKIEKISIYEQGLTNRDVDLRDGDKDGDFRANFSDTDLRNAGSRPDIDLRQLNLPFKAIQNYTPASEIDASINSHPPIIWKVYIVEVPKPDYTGLKLSAQDAQATGDPRLRKIFRLSTEDKDSPASPKQSPKASYGGGSTRVDPRRRKIEENKIDTNNMTYAQQLTMLQSSPFYQSLTSNQKLMLNQELSQTADHSGNNDPILTSMLNKIGLLQNVNLTASANAGALSILSNLNTINPIGNLLNQNILAQNPNLLAQNPNILSQNQNLLNPNQANLIQQNPANILQPNLLNNQLNPNILNQTPNIINQMAQSVGQPGLLGAAPGIPNLPPNFEINFDPRNGGLLGNAPFQNYDNNSNFNNYNDDFYEGNNFGGGNNGGGGSGGGGGGGNRNDNRGGFRDNRNNSRRGRNFNRNNGNRNFRNRNRSNRGHTPP